MRLFGGVRFPMTRPSLANVMRLDVGAIPMLVEMWRHGILCDASVLRGLEARLTAKQDAIQAQIDALAGRPFDTGSPDKVADFLFRELGCTPGRLTPSQKRPTVGEDALLKLRHDHPIVPLILDWRGVEKLLNTYVRTLPKMCGADGRIHGRLRNTVARTGRLSMEDPNLQNLPIQDEDGRLIRSAFCASPGCVIGDLDLAQIEMVVATHESKDPQMRDIFHRGLDIHIRTACALFHLSYFDVWERCVKVKAGGGSPEDIAWVNDFWQTKRLPSKTLGFQVLYGCTAQGLQDGIVAAGGPLIPLDDCERYIAGWFSEYAGVRDWMQLQYGRARRYGMVWDMFGRPRLIPEVHSALQGVRSAGLREAGNHPIQGGAAGILKLAMAEIQGLVEMFQANYPSERCWPLLQVHDELLFELSRPIAQDFCAMAKSIMETSVPLDVPVKAEYGIGMNWLEAH